MNTEIASSAMLELKGQRMNITCLAASDTALIEKTIAVLIADDHPLILDGLANLIESEPGLSLSGRATDGVQAVAKYADLRPDVMLIDLNMPGGSGLEAISRIRALDPRAKIVVLSACEGEEDVFRAMDSGASAYLLKQSSSEQILQCLHRIIEHGRYMPAALSVKLASRVAGDALSRRELEILAYLSTGKSNKMIARIAGIGVGTVKYHVNNILSKLNVSCRTEAACVAMQRGLIHLH